MLDAVKDYLTPKTFGVLVYVWSIVQIVYGLVFTAIVVTLKEGEPAKFTCYVAHESTLIYKTQVDKACYSRYQQKYNAPLQFYLFLILSAWSPIVVALIYSLRVRRRVEQVSSRINATQAESEADRQGQISGSSYVFYFYFFHLAIRALFGILFTILQYSVFFPNGFDFEFNCSLEPTQFRINTAQKVSLNETSVACENPSAPEKHILWVIVSLFNTGFAFIMVLEIIRLYQRYRQCDYTNFIIDYLLRNQNIPNEVELAPLNVNLEEFVVDILSHDSVESVSANLEQRLNLYKEQVLRSPRSIDVFFAPTTGLDDMYINLVIHSKRARHKFSKNMKRHEIYDVYMKVPNDSIRLKQVKDLFYPNKDTKDRFPKKILAIGRPGIGKTVLAEKVMRDWARGDDECYKEKVSFHFEFRWFNENIQNHVTLKTFLYNGTKSYSKEKFDEIYEYIIEHPEKAILVFDGLDEFNGSSKCLEQLPPPDDLNVSMSWISLFIKLISSRFLPEASLLVTSRPTANEFYSRLSFDRIVEIIGFSQEAIEAYVQKFCDHYDRSDLKPKIWEYINSNADILNLCYIPVNCWIVCTTLLDSLENSESEYTSLPNTLTELYQDAITKLDKDHFKNIDVQTSAVAIKNLWSLAFQGMKDGQLVFSSENFGEEMKNSGLLNKLSNPYSQAQQQFCFIHLTIQEFLAAKHVTETFDLEEINEFIVSHVKIGKWHLALQFIAGLLGKKPPGHRDCISAFAKCFALKNGELDLTDDISLLLIKCLRETNDEALIQKCNDETAMNDVKKLSYGPLNMFPATSAVPLPLALSDWEAVAFVCKHMKKMVSLDLAVNKVDFGRSVDVTKLLEQRCIKNLRIQSSIMSAIINVKGAISALLRSSCTVEHEHSKVTELHFVMLRLLGDTWSDFLNFFKQGRAHDLEKLSLSSCLRLSRQSPKSLFDVLSNEYCPKLTYLNLSGNSFSSENLRAFCGHRLFNLSQLYLDTCDLPYDCTLLISELLTDERCNLTLLSMEGSLFETKEKIGMLANLNMHVT